MAEAIIKRVFDTVRSNRNIDIISVNNDHGARFIEAVIAVDGKPIRVDLGCAVTIEAKRFDGASKAFSGSVNEDGTVKAPITQWMLEIPNTGVDATISVTTTKPSKLSTTNFTINVQDSPYKGEEISPDDPEYDVLMQVLAGEAEREAAEQVRQKNEAERAKQKQLFSNALKGKKSGGIVAMSDISPLEHTLDVRVRSKNLIPYPYINTSMTRGGVTFTDNGDGSITVKGTATTTTSFNFCNGNIFEVGKTYLLGVDVIVAYKDANGTSKWAGGASSNVTSLAWKNGYTVVMIYYQVAANKSVDETIYPFIVENTDTPGYTPYIPDISAVKVKKYADEPDAAIEYPVNADGTVDDVTSIYPTTTLMTDTAGAVIDVEYNRDINKAFAELYNAIISLGGNV